MHVGHFSSNWIGMSSLLPIGALHQEMGRQEGLFSFPGKFSAVLYRACLSARFGALRQALFALWSRLRLAPRSRSRSASRPAPAPSASPLAPFAGASGNQDLDQAFAGASSNKAQAGIFAAASVNHVHNQALTSRPASLQVLQCLLSRPLPKK